MAKNEQTKTANPDQVVLNKIQSKRLASLSGVHEREIAGKTVAQLADQLKWVIDPNLFFFRRICGKVVKKDPITGIEYPVPFATVYVEDTDCNLILYHPVGNPWGYIYPLGCTREVIVQTKTDACGNFCVWVPRFEIDCILRWRRERYCFPIIFRRPYIRDILYKTPSIPIPPPEPDPWERVVKISDAVINSIGGRRGEMLKTIRNSARLGNADVQTDSLLDQRLFDHELPPPLPKDFQQVLTGQNVVASKNASGVDAVRAEVARKLGLEPGAKELANFSYTNFIGPFYRCVDYIVPEWQHIKDAPDITFRVTQDTNGDGVEETIYSEGYFDVRWNAGAIPNITLQASSIARESRVCNVPEVPCGTVPDILLAGFMPLRNPAYFNDTTGYTLKTNRPCPSGVPNSAQSFPGTTPFCHTLQLYGCVNIQNAQYYRVHQSINGGAFSPITGLAWNNFLGSLPVPITSDTNGWYPVNPIHPITLAAIPRTSLAFENLVLIWPTPNATTVLKIELGDNSKNHIADSATVTIVSDNTAPAITTDIFAWKFEGDPDSTLRYLDINDCPMIKRGATPRDIEVLYQVTASALHFRDAGLSTSGCGDGAFAPVGSTANASHWHENATDNSVTLSQRYRLSSLAKPGCYGFNCRANSRAMNPSGGDGGNLIPPDWDYNPVFIYRDAPFSVAVVNENP